MLKIFTALAVLSLPFPALAECYSSGSFTLTKSSEGFVMETPDGAVDLYEGSAGIGADFRVLFTEDSSEGFPFYYENGNLVFDGQVYEKGCE